MTAGTHPTLDWSSLQAPLARRFQAVELLPFSGRVHDQAACQRGIDRLSSALPVMGLDRLQQDHQRFAAPDESRQAWLDNMGQTKDSLLLGVRGGYGITRLLDNAPLLDIAKRMTENRCVLTGHSDFTALQLALLSAALQARAPIPLMLQGPMLCIDWGLDSAIERTFTDFNRVLEGLGHVPPKPLTITDTLESVPKSYQTSIPPHGMLWGGNLSMLCALLGTPHFPDIDGGILFIEDVNEHPYRIERMLLQLHQAGVLNKQRALLVGECSDWKPSPLDNGYDLTVALEHIASVAQISIFTGLRFGHIADRLTLPVGQHKELGPASNGQVRLDIVPA